VCCRHVSHDAVQKFVTGDTNLFDTPPSGVVGAPETERDGVDILDLGLIGAQTATFTPFLTPEVPCNPGL
jgi:hypothetical protein